MNFDIEGTNTGSTVRLHIRLDGRTVDAEGSTPALALREGADLCEQLAARETANDGGESA